MNKIKPINLFFYFLFILGTIAFIFFIPRLEKKEIKPKFNELITTEKYLKKRLAMRNVFLKYNSPFIEEIDSFLYVCIKYDLNCYLLPAIAGVESGFGQQILNGSYNPFGWGGGYIYFDSWHHAFLAVAEGLKTKYIDQGLTTPELISPVYAPPSHTWAAKVNYYISLFEQEEKKVFLTIPRL